ncbi:MAG: hypothetical protein E6J41_16345 [Chloroflexi bacterium]|nr:MAG: hypothetical protein E6J41_16345 [Chloroflexota bacterium]
MTLTVPVPTRALLLSVLWAVASGAAGGVASWAVTGALGYRVYGAVAPRALAAAGQQEPAALALFGVVALPALVLTMAALVVSRFWMRGLFGRAAIPFAICALVVALWQVLALVESAIGGGG